MKRKQVLMWGFLMNMAFMGMVMLWPHLSKAGDLEPPSGAVEGGAPVSTMHTLGEIYTKLEEMDGKLEPDLVAPVMRTGQKTVNSSGDDGDLQKGVVWPDPRFTNNGDQTVTDNLTGLMWTKDANLAGSRKLWSEAMSYSAALELGGFTDWRLPNVRELQSLIDYGEYNPALPANHPFTNVQASDYWSSTTYAGYTGIAWYVDLGNGYVNVSIKSNFNYVWCVRGGS